MSAGLQIWRCGACGADGIGDAAALLTHVNKHPRIRFWLATRLRRLAARLVSGAEFMTWGKG